MHRDDPADDTPRYPGSGRLAGRVAFVSGGASGIGRAVVRLFAREGARVVIPWHDDEAEAREVEAREVEALARAEGAEALVLHLDAADRASCFAAIEASVARFGRLDVLVCNASIQTIEEDVLKITEDQVEQLFRTNVFGYLWLVQAALPHLGRGASVIFTTSVNAYRGNPLLIDYSASKGAELSLLRALSLNLADRGIRVNGVAPGPVWTPLIPETTPEEDLKDFGSDVPMKRPAQPAEIAPAFLFLACEDASYVTGQVIHPNGGTPVSG